jgi:hypothetical protein
MVPGVVRIDQWVAVVIPRESLAAVVKNDIRPRRITGLADLLRAQMGTVTMSCDQDQ